MCVFGKFIGAVIGIAQETIIKSGLSKSEKNPNHTKINLWNLTKLCMGHHYFIIDKCGKFH